MGIANQLHWTLTGVVLPLAALVGFAGALRRDLGRPWRWLLACAAGGVTTELALRGVRHGLAYWSLPAFVWLSAPVALGLLALAAARTSRVLALAFALAGVFALLGWVTLAALWLGGVVALDRLHDWLLYISLPLLVAGLWKHVRTPSRQVQTADAGAIAPLEPDPREQALVQRLDSPAAQEAADKYTRD
ncbi:MAG: hypothetical protein KF891_25000 [Rhizobacter sp.]|nr:hypothetical protein [Rhizobacter sp.]